MAAAAAVAASLAAAVAVSIAAAVATAVAAAVAASIAAAALSQTTRLEAAEPGTLQLALWLVCWLAIFALLL